MSWLRVVAHTRNPSTLGGQGSQKLRLAWATCQNTISTKKTKISQVWWCMPVVPATQEAEVDHLSPGDRGCSKLRLCHCILAQVAE